MTAIMTKHCEKQSAQCFNKGLGELMGIKIYIYIYKAWTLTRKVYTYKIETLECFSQ